jgi:hypothetical protein
MPNKPQSLAPPSPMMTEKQKNKSRAVKPSASVIEPQGYSSNGLSAAENAVLNLFSTYLMTPGKMLCLNNPDRENFKVPLGQLTSKGMLIQERYVGGYSLTETGSAAMKELTAKQP